MFNIFEIELKNICKRMVAARSLPPNTSFFGRPGIRTRVSRVTIQGLASTKLAIHEKTVSFFQLMYWFPPKVKSRNSFLHNHHFLPNFGLLKNKSLIIKHYFKNLILKLSTQKHFRLHLAIIFKKAEVARRTIENIPKPPTPQLQLLPHPP